MKVYLGDKEIWAKSLRNIDLYQITQHAMGALPPSKCNPMAILKTVVKLIPSIHSWPNNDPRPSLPIPKITRNNIKDPDSFSL
jgi:hypothetical protein